MMKRMCAGALLLMATACSPITSCEKYASDFSCKYVTEQATYEVLYWKNLQAEDPKDERVIGTVKGLIACKSMAQGFSASMDEEWNDRSYICALVKKNGGYAEKHRLLY